MKSLPFSVHVDLPHCKRTFRKPWRGINGRCSCTLRRQTHRRWVKIMVDHRGYHISKNLSTSRNRKSSFFSITLYVILIFALSIFTFILYSKDVLEDENKMPLFRVENSKPNQVRDAYSDLWLEFNYILMFEFWLIWFFCYSFSFLW